MISQVGCDFVRLTWDPPIIDGGATVYEHEICYDMMTKAVHKKGVHTVSLEVVLVCISVWRQDLL